MRSNALESKISSEQNLKKIYIMVFSFMNRQFHVVLFVVCFGDSFGTVFAVYVSRRYLVRFR